MPLCQTIIWGAYYHWIGFSHDDDLENHALDGDGEQLWNRVCDRTSVMRKVARAVAALGQATCTALAYKQLHEAQRQLA